MPELPEYPLHHDDRRVDDQAEIDGSDGQQVGGFSAQNHDDDGKKQRERDRCADDQGASKIAEKHPLQCEDQQNAEQHVVQDSMGGRVDQILTVIDALDSNARRQDA